MSGAAILQESQISSPEEVREYILSDVISTLQARLDKMVKAILDVAILEEETIKLLRELREKDRDSYEGHLLRYKDFSLRIIEGEHAGFTHFSSMTPPLLEEHYGSIPEAFTEKKDEMEASALSAVGKAKKAVENMGIFVTSGDHQG